jgi:hypothetical protein
MTNPITDRAVGVLQGAADVAQGATHEVRSGDRDRELSDRAGAAYARWLAGLPARNTFERDAYAAAEANLAAGMRHLAALGRQATAMEAARAAEAKGPEAGQ